MRVMLAAAAFGLAARRDAGRRAARALRRHERRRAGLARRLQIPPGRRRQLLIEPARGRFPSATSASRSSPGVAEVRGDPGRINSRWGEARRSRRDRACWVGEDFSICVY